MANSFGKVTRMSVVMAVLLAFIMLASPVLQIGGKTTDVSPVKSVQAAPGDRVFTVGQVDYGGGMASLNPFVYTQAEEMETVWPVYSTLVMYDLQENYIGDLASSWTVSPDGMTWDFKLVHNAYFVDPYAPAVREPSRLVTAKDVIWTLWECNNNSGNHLNSYVSLGPNQGVIESMRQGADQFEVILKTKMPYAPFLSGLTIIPIVPEYIWKNVNVMSYDNIPMVGSGPFYSTMTRVPQTLGILNRNPIWFQEENRGWQIHVDILQYKTELNPTTAWTELTTQPVPIIDSLLQVQPALYKNNLVDKTTDYVMGFAQETGFIYEYQLNQMSTGERTQLEKSGGVRNGGSNNQLLLDPTVKLALQMSIDRQEFIKEVLLGFGSPGDSVVPGVNPWHYTYPNPLQFDPQGARTLLMNAGWKYDSNGAAATSDTCPLYKKGPVNNTVYHPLSFRLLSLTPETEWDTGTRLIVNWSREAGVEYTRTLVSTNQANGYWYKGDYDAWLWDWGFSPTSDPSTDCLSVHTTGQIGVWSGSYWSNVTYDDLYNQSVAAVDPAARRIITDKMQALLYESHMVSYPAFRKDLYAVNFVTWNKTSYGDWAAHYMLMPDWYQPYLYMQLYPNDNFAPSVSIAPTFGPYYTNSTHTYFPTSTSDGSTLKYQFYWGDGTPNSGWQIPSYSFTHSFTKDGTYTIYFAAQEQGSPQPDDGFISWTKTQVTIIDPANQAPTNAAIDKTPGSGINQGTHVTFTGSANGGDGDPLFYTWSFGDGVGGVGQQVTHQFKTAGDFTVLLNVTDNHPGDGRPAPATTGIHVAVNGAPQVSFPSTRLVQMKLPYAYNVTATDPDLDAMRYTWLWGDGKRDVTTVPTATHTYAQKSPGISLWVWTDDLTGLSGHNVSRLETVTVHGAPTVPTITTFSVNATNPPGPVNALAGTLLMFVGTAKDQGGDSEDLTFQFMLGDGVWNNMTAPTPGINKQVTFSFTHAFQAAGDYNAYLYVYDGQDSEQSSGILITIRVNHPPTIVIQPLNRVGNVGVAVPVSVTANDQDSGTVLRYTWDFGDGTMKVVIGSGSTSHIYTTPGNRTFTVYVDDQSSLVGHNVSSAPRNAAIAFVLSIHQGYNLVSIPFIGPHYWASKLGLQSGDGVVGWNSATGVYDKSYIIGLPMVDFMLEPNTAYWIYAGAARTLTFYGLVPTTQQTRVVDIPAAGYATVGMCSFNTSRTASSIVSMYAGGTVIGVISWDATAQKYIAYIPGLPFDDFALVPGQGYWIYVSGAGTFTYDP